MIYYSRKEIMKSDINLKLRTAAENGNITEVNEILMKNKDPQLLSDALVASAFTNNLELMKNFWLP